MSEAIYHVCTAAAWKEACGAGIYSGSADDRADGYIHFSTASQLRASVAKHRAGQSGLVLLSVDPALLGDNLKWEPARGGQLFPHLYGRLPVPAVARADPLPLDASGGHVFPEWVP